MEIKSSDVSKAATGASPIRRGLTLSLRRAALAGSVAVLALGIGAALSPMNSATPAYAEAVSLPVVSAPSFADVVAAVRPAVVSVRVKEDITDQVASNSGSPFGDMPQFRDLPPDHPLNRFFRQFGEPGTGQDQGQNAPRRPAPHRYGMAQGSGFIISADGYIVTNNHVVENGKSISVVLDNGDEVDAKLIGTDSRTDLAVLKIDDGNNLTYVDFDDQDIRVGDWVVSMGNPFGLGGTVTAGIVSARGRDIGAGPYDDFLQIDAAVNRGNSGGPTFALNGKVIGVNTAIFSPNGGNVGIAFAIPASTAKVVVNDLIKNGSVTRGWLGVQIQPVTKDIAESLGLDSETGALVADVTADSPASKAGLETGDTVVSVNGTTVKDPKDLARQIAAIKPGEEAKIGLWRDGSEKTFSVKIGELPGEQKLASLATGTVEKANADLDKLGLQLAAGDDGKVVISDVDPNGQAAEKGLQPGDAIVKVNGDDVSAPADVVSEVAKAEKAGRKAVLFLVQSNGRSRFVALDLKTA